MLNAVGGFYTSLFFAGLVLYSQFQGSFFFAAIIGKLYQIEHLIDEDLETSKKDGYKLSSVGRISFNSRTSGPGEENLAVMRLRTIVA